MEWQQTAFILPLVITGALTFASAMYAYRQRQVAGAIYMHRMMLAVTIWIVFYTLELSSVHLETKQLWAKLQYIGIVYVPVGYFLFVLNYIGEFHKIKRPRQFHLALLLIPAIVLLLALTSNWQPFLWRSTGLIVDQGISYLTIGHGAWFWVEIGYAYLLLSSSSLLLLRKLATTSHQFRGQIIFALAGSLFPWLANALYITSGNPTLHLDLTPFGFSVTAICFIWALFRYSFLDIVPMAQGMIMEKLEDGVIVLDGQNRVIDLNETAVSLLQQDKRGVLGLPFTPHQPHWAALETILKENQPARTELLLAEAYYEATTTILDSVSSQANGRLITLHNITQQKNTQLLLQRAEEAADAAEQAKTNFLTNMSHEIRTPLNAVVGMAELLRQSALNPNQREMLDVIAHSSSNLMLLINNILDFAKLEAGDLTLTHQVFNLVDCLEASLDSMRQAASEKQLKLSYQLDAQTPTNLTGDPVRLRQILVNLLENGIKFTEEGQIEIAISYSQQQEDCLLQFVVKDSGIGISPNHLGNLFVPFHQVDGSMTREHGGNGLGLVVCQRLVALMGGDINISSIVGEGTTVHFSAQFSPAPEKQLPAITLRHHKASLLNKRLLVITRDAAHRRKISKEARVAGLEVYAAGSYQEASYWINNSQPFDVVLLDTAVWQEEPFILSQLKNRESSTFLPTILLKPEADELPQEATTDAFVGTLALPIAGSQLYDILMNVLSAGNGATADLEMGQLMANRLPLKILLAEDNELNQRILKNMLDKLGYEIDLAENGQIAIEAIAQTHYDVVLMDIQMPVMDGVEATQHLMATYPAAERPYIIAVTAHALEGDREYYLSTGMNAYLSKPVTLNQLVEVLYQSRDDREPRTSTAGPETGAISGQNDNSPVDFQELAVLVGSDTEEFLEMMTPIFLEDTHEILGTLANAVQIGDGPAMQQAAHTLKGTSASMAMKTLSQHCRELEMLAKTSDLAKTPLLLQKIQVEYGRIESALTKWQKTAV